MALVLVVDDEVGISTLLKDVLEDDGHLVLLATNGRQALDKVKDGRPDLIVTDFMMPVMDGAALIRALAAEPRWKDIPVVVMSSMPEAAVAERCSGYATFVRKPFRIFDLLDDLKALLDRAT
jgi:CheY-like chemotaxis protein